MFSLAQIPSVGTSVHLIKYCLELANIKEEIPAITSAQLIDDVDKLQPLSLLRRVVEKIDLEITKAKILFNVVGISESILRPCDSLQTRCRQNADSQLT